MLVRDLIRPLPGAPTGPALRAALGAGPGDGPVLATGTQLRNATLLPDIPHEEFPALLAAADILLVPLRDVPPAHDRYWRRRDRPRHRRRWSLTRDGLRIDDLFTGTGRHEIVIRWHLSVGASAQLTDDTAAVTSAAGTFLMTVEATSPVALAVETRPVAVGLASTADAPVLTCRMNADLPTRATTSWSRARGGGGGGGGDDDGGGGGGGGGAEKMAERQLLRGPADKRLLTIFLNRADNRIECPTAGCRRKSYCRAFRPGALSLKHEGTCAGRRIRQSASPDYAHLRQAIGPGGQ